MAEFADTPIPYVPIADKATEVRAAIDAARLSAANSFGGLQKLAIPGPFATDAEASTGGVPDDNLYYRSDGTVRAASHISLDLAFALDKTLTARTGPTPTFSRASSGLFVNANGILVGKTAGTTTSITPSAATIGTTQVTVTVASGSVVGWLVGQSVSLIVDVDGGNDNDPSELWLVGTIVSMTATELVFTVTEKTATAGSATTWTLGYRGARFDHDPATGDSKGLLIEEQRENFALHSQSFSNSYWSSFATATATDDITTSPSGVANSASRITATSGTDPSRYRLGLFSITAGSSPRTASVFLKAGTHGFGVLILAFNKVGAGAVRSSEVRVNLATGSAVQTGTLTGFSFSVTQHLDGWWRIALSATSNASTAVEDQAVMAFGLSFNATGTSGAFAGTETIFGWGAQLEAGTFATSYIPTTSGTAARSADVCSIIGGDFSSFYNQSEGTIFARYSVVAGFSVTGRTIPVCAISNQSFNEAIRVGSPTANLNMAFDTVASGTQTRILATSPISLIGSNTAAGAYKISDSGFSNNSATTLSGSPASITTLVNRFDIGGLHPGSGVLPLNGHIARIQYFRKRLPNAKLQTLTAP